MSDSEEFPGIAPDLPQSKEGSAEAASGKNWKAQFAPNPDGKRALRRRLKRPKRTGLNALSQAARAAMAGQLDLAAGHLDHRTAVARELRQYRQDLIARREQQGGLTPEAETLIDMAVTDKLIMSSLDASVRELGAAGLLVDKEKRGVIPLLRDRSYLASDVTRRLQALGLEPGDVRETNLTDYLAAKAAEKRAAAAQDEPAIEVEPAPSGDG